MTVAVVTQIAYAAQNLFDPAGTVGRLVDLGKLANYGLLGTKWSPAFLFLAGEQGAWYDPSDMTTLFQDAAGTTPVTAVEQPVGLMLDKSGRGNHAMQSTSTKRPVLSARVNLLTKTEDISTADWSKLGTSAPNADTLLELAGSGVHRVSQSKNVPATKCCLYAEFYPAGRSSCSLSVYDDSAGTTRANAVFSISGTGAVISGGDVLNKISLLPDGWYGCYIESASAFSGGNVTVNIGVTDGAAQSYTGDATKGVRVRKVDFRPVNTGVNLPAYQRVNTATDYDTQGFPTYLKFDGIDDALQTNSIDFTATDKMTTWVGYRFSNLAGYDTLLDGGVSTAGTISLFSTSGRVENYLGSTSGYAYENPSPSTLTSRVQSCSFDLAKPSITTQIVPRVNGAAVSTAVTGSYGTAASFSAQTYCIGSLKNSTFYMQGNLYGLIVRGAQSTAAQIESTEQWVNGKTAAF